MRVAPPGGSSGGSIVMRVSYGRIQVLALSLLVPMLVACGGGDAGGEPTITPIPFVPVAQESPTPLPKEFTSDRFTPVANPTTVPTPMPKEEKESFEGTPGMTIDVSKKYKATFELGKTLVSESGTFVVELFADKAPNTVNNFVFLARQGFFDGLLFHRVISGDFAMSGSPTDDVKGGPGYDLADEFHPELRHDKAGTVSMANKGLVNGQGTGGSQFFITMKPKPHLDGLRADGSAKDCQMTSTEYSAELICHTVFGQVIEGMEVVQKITPYLHEKGSRQPPRQPVVKVTITEE